MPRLPEPTPMPEQFDYEPVDLTGKTVLVTGGTTGIGKAIALLLADRGARVMIYGRDRKDLAAALSEMRQGGRDVSGITADQSKLGDIQKVFEHVDRQFDGKLDILVNNAAVAKSGVTDSSLEDIQYELSTNLLGYIACTKEGFARMKKRGGHIVFIGSMSADEREKSGAVYVATKAGIQGFAEAFRKEANESDVRVSLIEPGAVGSDMQPRKSTHKRKAEKGEMLRPEDIAACVHYVLTQPPRCDVVEVKIRPIKQLI